ncbi:MAG: tetratricopeptide repeat protein [Candidatus Eisenbacteria bacterium]|uniref:Tetratricopeptide repeat protein n=1 Tax=Eiseniibacteriota bacterium TaxID=2212470 RepID=A0A7Y2H482_UNCEI|nr:tetratricopeptide repeat protein [Candidatus Eisenbacteria bacterium]
MASKNDPLRQAIAYHRAGKTKQAESIYRKLVRRQPEAPDPYHLLGCIELGRKHYVSAVDSIKRAIALAPTISIYHENLAEAYRRSGDLPSAKMECNLALRFDPKSHAATNRLGIIALKEGELETALDYFQKALELKPGYGEALVNLGSALCRLGNFKLAKDVCDLATELDPNNLLAWNNLGLAYKGMGRLGEASQAFSKAQKLPMARYNQGYIAMLRQEVSVGLPLLEERKQLLDLQTPRRGREWNGHPKPKKQLLVIHEQGMGDSLLMSQFLPQLQAQFSKIIYAVQAPLQRVIQSSFPDVEVVTDWTDVKCDFWCSAMSLPYRLGLDLPPAPSKAWIKNGPGRRAGPRLQAGINWAGNPKYLTDRSRSTSLDTFRALLEIEGVDWVSLNKGPREDEAQDFNLPEPLREAKDFSDTAAVVSQLDLVVSTETSVPNLSGAMGVPTLVLGAVDHDWRWYGWFPNVQVCAQDTPGDWEGVVKKAAKEIAAHRDRASSGELKAA